MALEIQTGVQLRDHTTFKVGGEAAFFVQVTSESGLVEAVAYARSAQLPITILGGGSNVLVDDAGIEGLVIQVAIKGSDVHQDAAHIFLTVGAGEQLDDVVRDTVAAGYWGLENLSYIPGTVGAAPIQNVGAYGVEIGTVVSLVRVFDCALETFTTFDRTQCQFGYRDSFFKTAAGKRYVITAVTFLLSTEPHPQLTYKDLATWRLTAASCTQQAIREAVITIRAGKFPDWHRVGTAGSFFKNPIIPRVHYEKLLATYPDLPHYVVDREHVKIPLGWVLDKICNLRGFKQGNVGCYEGQALVIVADGGALADQIVSFATMVRKKVFEMTRIAIEWEVTMLP